MVSAEADVRYIRRVTTDPDNHSVVLFTDEMIEFIERHCGRTTNKSPIHVDTTYNLTNGYAVICTLRAIDFEGDPLLLGPILVTKRQRECDISILWNAIIKANSKLRDLDLVFVTDGDDSIVNSIKNAFNRPTLFRCRLHLLANLKQRLSQMGGTTKLNRLITTSFNDLINAETVEQFITMSKLNNDKWKQVAKDCGVAEKTFDGFMKYYHKWIGPVIRHNIVQITAAAGMLFKIFDNNPAESINAIVKGWCQNQKLPIDQLVSTLKTGSVGLYEELKRGYIQMSRKFISKDSGSSVVALRKLHKSKTILSDLMTATQEDPQISTR